MGKEVIFSLLGNIGCDVARGVETGGYAATALVHLAVLLVRSSARRLNICLKLSQL